MYNPDKKDNYMPDSFFTSDNWLAFCAKFGAYFYEFKPDSLSTMEWAEFAHSCSSSFDTLIDAVEKLAELNPDLKRPGLAKLKSIYFDLRRQRKTEHINNTICNKCNSERVVVNVQLFRHGHWQPVQLGSEPFKINHGEEIQEATLDCSCNGGNALASDSRWIDHKYTVNGVPMTNPAINTARDFCNACRAIK